MTLSRRSLFQAVAAASLQRPLKLFKGEDKLDAILRQAAQENWRALPIGERVGRVALALKDTPYVGFTLDIDDDHEYCTVDLDGLDCVTFFEDALDIARILRKRPSKEALLDEIRFTRYRGGRQGDFTSRLHYTKEWIADNVRKGVVKDITPTLPGAQPFTQQVGFMSTHPEAYRQLKAHPSLIPKIAKMEQTVNAIHSSYLPLENIADAEPLLNTGDIVGVTTSEEGIDIAHTGLCLRDADGLLHFFDASSNRRRMKVTMEGRLSASVRWSKSLTGIVVARPLEVANSE